MKEHLALTDNLEKMRLRLEEVHQRPCFLVSEYTPKPSANSLYRKPGTFEYTKGCVEEFFFSHWTDNSRCVRVDEGPPRVSYFDLDLAPKLMFILPSTQEERMTRELRHDQFKAVGLKTGWSPYTSLWSDNVGDDLKPYVRLQRGHGPKGKKPCVQFHASMSFDTPLSQRNKWHLADLPGASFQAIQAPGQYNGKPLVLLTDVNRMARVECDPGPCVVCHGTKGERVHLASMYQGSSVFPRGHICRGCTADTFAQWQELLGPCQVKAPPNPRSVYSRLDQDTFED